MMLTPEEKMTLFQNHVSNDAYQAKHFKIQRDDIDVGNGRTHVYDIAVLPGASVMIPITSDNRIIFTRQYRHCIKQILYELPAGKIDNNEDPRETAIRELQEEIHKYPGHLVKIFETYPAPGYSTEILHFYVAKELTDRSLPPDEFEAIDIVHFSLEEAIEMVKNGKIIDGKSALGILYYEKTL